MAVTGLFGGGCDLGGPPYVIQNLLDYFRVSNIGDNADGADTQWAQANIKIKDSFEPLSPSQGGDRFIFRVGVLRPSCVRCDRFLSCFFKLCGNDEFRNSCTRGEMLYMLLLRLLPCSPWV